MKMFAQGTAWCLTGMEWDGMCLGALHQQHFEEEEGNGAPLMHFQLVHH